MRRGRWVMLVVALAVGSYVFVEAVPLVSSDEFRTQVERNIPPGTPMPAAETWLRTNGYPCFHVVDATGRRVGVWGDFRNYISGRLGVEFFPTSLEYEIRFDGDGKSTGDILVREITTSL